MLTQSQQAEVDECRRETHAAVRKHITEERAAGRDPDTAALWWSARSHVNELADSFTRSYSMWDEPVFDGDW